MSCETVIYEVEAINDNDVLLKYKQSVCGYDFLEYLPFGVEPDYNRIKPKELIKAFKGSKRTLDFDIDIDKDYVIDVSY